MSAARAYRYAQLSAACECRHGDHLLGLHCSLRRLIGRTPSARTCGAEKARVEIETAGDGPRPRYRAMGSPLRAHVGQRSRRVERRSPISAGWRKPCWEHGRAVAVSPGAGRQGSAGGGRGSSLRFIVAIDHCPSYGRGDPHQPSKSGQNTNPGTGRSLQRAGRRPRTDVVGRSHDRVAAATGRQVEPSPPGATLVRPLDGKPCGVQDGQEEPSISHWRTSCLAWCSRDLTVPNGSSRRAAISS
jgi:hypothetical protein